jgi:hypothetical protein
VILSTVASTQAATVLTTGAGSAVTRVDRLATFDSITRDHIDLSAYTEDGLSIAVPNQSAVGHDFFGTGVLTALYYGRGGDTSFVTIKTTDATEIFGLEFLFGHGFSDSTNVDLGWETWNDGMLVSSGVLDDPAKGTVVGWSDTGGFDELRVGAGHGPYSFGDQQAIALDNVRVELIPDSGSALLLMVMSFSGLHLLRRSQGASKVFARAALSTCLRAGTHY